MSAGFYIVAEAAITAIQAGVERDIVIAKIKQRELDGATPQQIARELGEMADDAIAKTQADINAA